MIEFSGDASTLTMTYNGHTILRHTRTEPAFYLGKGQADIDSYRGNYQIDDHIDERIALTDVFIDHDTVTFSRNELSLQVRFAEVDHRLVLSFEGPVDYNRFWMRLFATAEEHVYGCGEQASYFDLRHRHFPLWTSESGVGRDKQTLTTYYADLYDKAGGDYYTTYYPEPTFVSSRKYWCHVDSFAYADFDFRHSQHHELFFWEIPGKAILSFKDSYLALVEDLTDFTKRPPILPEFLLDGMILGVQGGMTQVLDYLQRAEHHGVKVSGLWCQDWAGHKQTSFGKRLFWNWRWNETVYPGLKDLIQTLTQKNVAFLTYICPFLLENESLFNEAAAQGFLALDKEGRVYTEDFGEFDCGIVDLTNPEAFHWYKNIIKTNIIDLGIRGWMADFGEYLPIDCVLHNGKDAKAVHNEWPILWAKCNYEAVKESGKLGEVFYFMRAGAFGSQHYATSLWAGDQSVNWDLHDGIASVIPASLSTGIIGNPFTHSDIGGYTSLHGNIRTKELFERWLEMNVFSAYMRTHEGNRPSENFQFYNDDSTMELMARLTTVRVMLKPYVKQLYVEGSEKGYPVIRPLFMHYEDDELTYGMQDQYLFGPDVLVKPVTKPQQTIQEVYLPDDTWIHLWTGDTYHGGQTVTVSCPIGYPPVFYKVHSAFKPLFESITTYDHL